MALLSSTETAEAAKAFQILKPHGIGLLEAVREYLDIHNRRKASITFFALCNQYLAAKSKRDPRHLKGLRNTRDRFPTLHEQVVSDIDHRMLEPLVNAILPGGRNLVLRHLRSFFNYAVRKDFAVTNPVARLDFVEIPPKEVEVIAPEDVQRMLECSLSNDLELVPFLALAFFTGIRPEELMLLQWQDVDLPSREINLRATVSKTRTSRFPVLSENSIAWLEAYRARGGRTEGPIIDLKEDAMYAHRQKIRLAAGVNDWPQDAARHSFCSYWIAAGKGVEALLQVAGHENPRTLKKHYHRGVTRTEAAKFWAIVPTAIPANVISMAN
jgi:integrase